MKTQNLILVSILTLILAAGVSVGRLNAQAATATVLGSVTDSSGAAIPEATLQVRNVGTASTRSVMSDGQGRYNVPDLPIGEYDIQASKIGFQTLVRKGITLTVGSEPVVDFQLPVGQAEQTINVEGTVSQVETATSAVSSLVNQAQMRDMPLNGRNFEQLILLAPGAISYPAGGSSALVGRAATFSVSGARPEGHAILTGRRKHPGLVATRVRCGGHGDVPWSRSHRRVSDTDQHLWRGVWWQRSRDQCRDQVGNQQFSRVGL
jgi:hypothetical protein